MAACEDFADGHLLQAFSLVGTRGDAELMLLAEAENLERIHEFHVVLGQSGLMKWADTPYSFLGMRKSSEYSEDERSTPRAFRGKYVFVYPFVKSREWYALSGEERWRIMQGHITIGREYPGVDNHTAYSFGLDDQEFVVAFDTDDVGTFLDLVQRLRTTEASRYTVRDTPSFTCIRMSLERALNALDGEPVALETRAAGGLTPCPRLPAAPSAVCARRTRCWRSSSTRPGRSATRATAGPIATTTTARSCARSSASSFR